MPWSMALRMMWVSGSTIRSTIDLSSSVSAPATFSSMLLPSSLERSRTMRGKRWKTSPTGTMRSPMADSRRRSRSSERTVRDASHSRAPSACAAMRDEAPAITSSPTRSIRESSLSASTRTMRLPTPAFPRRASCRFSADSTTGAGTAWRATSISPMGGGTPSADFAIAACSARTRSSSTRPRAPQATSISPRREAGPDMPSSSSTYSSTRAWGGTIRIVDPSETKSKADRILSRSQSVPSWIAKSSWSESGSPPRRRGSRCSRISTRTGSQKVRR